MDTLRSTRRRPAAWIFVATVAIPMLLAACNGGSAASAAASPAASAASGDPAAVVREALAKAAAKDIDGLAGLACAGQADQLKADLDLTSPLAGQLSGLDVAGIASATTIDTSGVVVGTPTITGDTAEVPISGVIKVNVDKDKVRPLVKAYLDAQGGGVTLSDDQIDQLLDSFGGSGQGIPVDRSLTLQHAGGAWTICQPSPGNGDEPSPSAGY